MLRRWVILGLFLTLCPELRAQDGSKGHPFVATTFTKNKVIVVSADGKVEWEYDAKACVDVWKLPNDNFLIASRAQGIIEVTREKKIVFQYKTEGETYTCQRLANGDTLIGDNRNGRLIEVDAKGKIQREVKIQTKAKEHGMIRSARRLANGHYLVCQREDNLVREYEASGKIAWEFKTNGPMTAIRLPNERTLIANASGDVLEVDSAGKIQWQVGKKDLPAKAKGVAYGIQRLPNGNTVIGYPGLIVEFTPDRKVVWSRTDAYLDGLMCFQLLDVPGNVVQGEVLR